MDDESSTMQIHTHTHTREVDESFPLLGENSASSLEFWDARSELWILMEYSLPLIGTYLLQYSFTLITTFVAGHLSSDDLAATSIGLTTLNLVGYATFEGMATSLDTLCAQAYGSESYHGVGLHVQRMMLLMTVSMVPIGAVWLLSPWILPLFVKQEYLAAKAASFLHVSLVGLPAYAFFEALKRFLQTQGDCNAALVILLICAPINAALSWFLAFKLDLGLEGAALGAALTNNIRAIMLVLYIAYIAKWSHKCWGGFTRAAWSHWGPMVRLSAAGTALNLGEWLAFEIVTFSTSYIGTEHLAAMTILTQLSATIWHIPFSFSVAVSIRIGHMIGAGTIAAAKRASLLYGVVLTIVGFVGAAIMFALRDVLPRIFSNDELVRSIASQAMVTVALAQTIDALNVGTGGILRGLGRQSFAGLVVFPVNYLIAVPLAIWLELGPPDLKLNGTWIGLTVGLTLTFVVNCIYMKIMSWEDCAESAKKREGHYSDMED